MPSFFVLIVSVEQGRAKCTQGDSGRSKKKMGVDTGGQSGFAICEFQAG
jgi:hypothetical protein